MQFDATEIMVDWVREFYNNMDVVSALEVKTYVLGKWLSITPTELGEFLDILVLTEFDYLVSSETLRTIAYDAVATTLCGRETRWIECVLPHGLSQANTGSLTFLCVITWNHVDTPQMSIRRMPTYCMQL